jgi:hypothetical protein
MLKFVADLATEEVVQSIFIETELQPKAGQMEEMVAEVDILF